MDPVSAVSGAIEQGSKLVSDIIGLFKKTPPTADQQKIIDDTIAMSALHTAITPQVNTLIGEFRAKYSAKGLNPKQATDAAIFTMVALGKLPKPTLKSDTFRNYARAMQDFVDTVVENANAVYTDGSGTQVNTPKLENVDTKSNPNPATAGFMDEAGKSFGSGLIWILLLLLFVFRKKIF